MKTLFLALMCVVTFSVSSFAEVKSFVCKNGSYEDLVCVSFKNKTQSWAVQIFEDASVGAWAKDDFSVSRNSSGNLIFEREGKKLRCKIDKNDGCKDEADLIKFALTELSNSTVYCVTDGERYNLRSSNGGECASSLTEGSGACFVGKRLDVIELLNSEMVKSMFDGSDGEYIKDAHFEGKDSISYTYVDDSNFIRMKYSIKRCGK